MSRGSSNEGMTKLEAFFAVTIIVVIPLEAVYQPPPPLLSLNIERFRTVILSVS
jgi:hypothetical protein